MWFCPLCLYPLFLLLIAHWFCFDELSLPPLDSFGGTVSEVIHSLLTMGPISCSLPPTQILKWVTEELKKDASLPSSLLAPAGVVSQAALIHVHSQIWFFSFSYELPWSSSSHVHWLFHLLPYASQSPGREGRPHDEFWLMKWVAVTCHFQAEAVKIPGANLCSLPSAMVTEKPLCFRWCTCKMAEPLFVWVHDWLCRAELATHLHGTGSIT